MTPTNTLFLLDDDVRESAQARQRVISNWLSVTKPAALAAWNKADALLIRHMNAEQQETYGRYRAFCVVGSAGNVYVVTSWTQSNVFEYTNRRWLCVVFSRAEAAPMPDLLLMQKLLLESDESAFLSQAMIDIRLDNRVR